MVSSHKTHEKTTTKLIVNNTQKINQTIIYSKPSDMPLNKAPTSKISKRRKMRTNHTTSLPELNTLLSNLTITTSSLIRNSTNETSQHASPTHAPHVPHHTLNQSTSHSLPLTQTLSTLSQTSQHATHLKNFCFSKISEFKSSGGATTAGDVEMCMEEVTFEMVQELYEKMMRVQEELADALLEIEEMRREEIRIEIGRMVSNVVENGN